MSLAEYSKRRKLSGREKTPEPEGEQQKKRSKKKLIYVIHSHFATHHHYDLRLEEEGVLKSWAVPKEPPLAAGTKRLAIQVEDHPLEYAKFHGCFEFYTKVITEKGSINIGKLVNEKVKINVLSYNWASKKLEWKPVTDWFKSGQSREWLKIRVPGQFGGRRVVLVTPNHRIYTPQGSKDAAELKEGDSIFVPGVKLSNEQLQVVIGSILGDAHVELSKETMVPQYSVVHSGKQINYLKFTRDLLNPKTEIRSRSQSDSHRFRFSHVGLINLYPLFYNAKKKYVNEEILDMLDQRGLAVWYMDDGYLSAKRFVELCTHGFSKKENQTLADYLKRKWELNAKVYYSKPKKKSTGGYFIHLDRLSSMRFLTLVNNYLLPELRYKTYIKDYKNKWKMEKGRQDIIPARIIKISKASRIDVRSLQRYDLQIKDNHNYFAGSMLVSNSIPEGNYGAGEVKIWDSGTYETLEKNSNSMKIKINGKKLKGDYVLVKTHFGSKPGKSWLFFKT